MDMEGGGYAYGCGGESGILKFMHESGWQR